VVTDPTSLFWKEKIMSNIIEMKLTNLDEIDVMDLQNTIRQGGVDDPALVTVESDKIPVGSHGDPGLIAALIPVVPQLVSVLSAAVAVWIAKGRKNKKVKGRKLILTKNGISYAQFSLSDFEEQSSTDAIKKVLTDALENKDNQSGKPAQ
jgi:hypothetical protein